MTQNIIQQIFSAGFTNYQAVHPLSKVQLKASNDILACRTEAMGARVDVCDSCGNSIVRYNSCRNRHCPVCQTFAQEKWLNDQMQNALAVPTFHVVFTVPAELNSLFLANQAVMYDLLFAASSQTVLSLCADREYLGAVPGIVSILHTWGSNLAYHPHVHMSVTGGGLADGRIWREGRKKKFFIPVRVLGAVFRGKFMDLLKKAIPDADPSVIDACWQKDWVVYCKPPIRPGSELRYFARYSHRVAISNERIVRFDGDTVEFRFKDYKHGGKMRTMSLSTEEFIRRFLMHVLPRGFRKIRHYGIYAARDKKKRIEKCRILTRTAKPAPPLSTRQLLEKILGPDFDLCPVCKVGRMRSDPQLE